MQTSKHSDNFLIFSIIYDGLFSQGLPKHSTVTSLLCYVTDAKQKAWLQSLTRKDNRAAFKQFFEDNHYSIFDLLTNELTSCAIPLSDFLNLVPVIQPRYYTISSSSVVFPKTVHVTFGITEKKLASGKSFMGLCSRYVVVSIKALLMHIFNHSKLLLLSM